MILMIYAPPHGYSYARAHKISTLPKIELRGCSEITFTFA